MLSAKVIGLSGLLLSIAAGIADAQENAYPPVVKDLQPKDTLPADGAFDIRGIQLGATMSEVIAAYKGITSDSQPAIEKSASGIRDNRGNSVSFAYDTRASINVTSSDGVRESYYAYFTTKVNESRAVKISRNLSYSNATQQASLAALIDSLVQKYGQPSYRENSGNSINLYFVWFDGKRTTLNPQTVQTQRYTRGTPANCMSDYTANYGFAGRRENPSPGCSGTIHARIELGTRADLVGNLKIEMWDPKRFYKNGVDTDAWLESELQKKISGQSGSAAPKL